LVSSSAFGQTTWKVFSLRVRVVVLAVIVIGHALSWSLLSVAVLFESGGFLLGVHQNGVGLFVFLFNYLFDTWLTNKFLS